MAANVETMFYVRETPWHGLGTRVIEAPASKEALELAGLNWQVRQDPVYTQDRILINGYKANVRDVDDHVLGIVTNRYRVVQNEDAFAFTDSLLGAGVRYETAGSLQGGRKVWLLARMPHNYIISGEQINPYLLFSNTHDGSGSVKVCLTPIRVVCNNTLNLALSSAKRSWSMIHTGNIEDKLIEAENTLGLAETYMKEFGKEVEKLKNISLSDQQLQEYIEVLLPYADETSPTKVRNINRLREDLSARYHIAPDLKHLEGSAYKFINAVSDFATHAEPIRRTKNYKENLFMRTMDGNPLIDKAYQMVLSA